MSIFYKNELINNIYEILILSFVFCLSWLPSVSKICLVLLVLCVLYQKIPLRPNRLFYTFIAVFGILVVGYFFSENQVQAQKELTQKLALLVCPFVLFASPLLPHKSKETVLYMYSWGCVLATIYRFAYLWWFRDTGIAFFSTPFSNIIPHSHPTLAAFYNAFAFFILLRWSIRKTPYLSPTKIGLAVLGLVILYVSLYFFVSRIALLVFTTVLIGTTVIYFLLQKKISLALLIVAFEIIASIGTAKVVAQLLPSKGSNPVKRFERLQEQNPRIEIWKSSFSIIKTNPVLGIGIGDVKDELIKQYQIRGFKKGFDAQFDAHNQYIEMALMTGIVGCVLFLISILLPFGLVFQEQQYIYLIFLSLFALGCMTENLLESQEGVLWYAFLNAFFASQFLSRNDKKTMESDLIN